MIAATQQSTTARRAVLAVGVAAVLVGGVVSGAARAAAADGRSPVTYDVAANGAVTGPKHTQPGAIAFALTGAQSESFQLVKSRTGAGLGKLVKDVNKLSATGDARPLVRDFELRGGAHPGTTLYLTLEPGTYYAVDSNQQTLMADQVQVIRVSGETRNASVPEASTIRAVGEMTWAKQPRQIPASGFLNFENTASMTHFVVMARLRSGKHVSDALAAFQGQQDPSTVFFGGPMDGFDNGAIGPGHSEEQPYSLNPGHYVLACFWPEDNFGPPHAFLGMVRAIRVG